MSLAAQAAFNPATVGGKIQRPYICEGENERDEEGEKRIHVGS